VHFDLKPANVFLRGDVARLGDYGLSRIVTGSRQSLSVGRGTPYYMAPELVRRRGDARSDVYSFGVLLYECLSGRVPFQGENEWEVLQRHERDAVQWPASIPAFVRPLLARCLEKDPARRFGDGVELLSALQACSAPGMRANAAGASTTTSDAAGMDDPVAFVVKASAARLRRGNGPALEMSDLGSRRPTRSWFLAVGLLVILVYGFKRARSADHRYGAVVWDSGAVAVAATPLPVPAAFAFAPEEAVAIAPEPGIDWVARGEEISASVIEYLERSRWITADVAAEARRLRKEILRHCR
jgi:serine/threonine-protein kinase